MTTDPRAERITLIQRADGAYYRPDCGVEPPCRFDYWDGRPERISMDIDDGWTRLRGKVSPHVHLCSFHSQPSMPVGTVLEVADGFYDQSYADAAHAPRGAVIPNAREVSQDSPNDTQVPRATGAETPLTRGCSIHPSGVACKACLASAARQERERICAWLRSLNRGRTSDALYTTMAETIERDAREAAEGGRDE